jgi:hypothetical protein
VAIASEQTADGYGIVSLILSTTHFDANERFIPGFVTTQPVVIPSYLIDANNVVTKVTGKFGGNGIEGEDRICWLLSQKKHLFYACLRWLELKMNWCLILLQ